MNRTIQTTRNRMLTPSQLKTTMVLSIISLVINPLFGIGTALDSFFFDSQIEINNQRNTSAPKKNRFEFFRFSNSQSKNKLSVLKLVISQPKENKKKSAVIKWGAFS